MATTTFAHETKQKLLDQHPYTRLALNDTSSVSANAKRYAANILMRPPVTRLRAEAVVRRATDDIRKERYNLDGFKKFFGDRVADVVSLYVAGDLQDAAISNWYCQTMWVSKSLGADVRPERLGDIELGDGLEVVWNADYDASYQFYHGLQLDKQTFLTKVKDFTKRTESQIADAFGHGERIICAPEDLAPIAASMRELYIASSDVGLPPFECKDVAHPRWASRH